MGQKSSRPDGVFLNAIVYNGTYNLPEAERLDLKRDFMAKMIGIPVTVEHAYTKIYQILDRHSKGTAEQRIKAVQEHLYNTNQAIGDVKRAWVSERTGSLLTEIQLRDITVDFLKEMKIDPSDLKGIGTSLTHGISSKGDHSIEVHPIEVAVTAGPKRPGCRIIGPTLQMADKKKALGEFLDGLDPATRAAIENAIETSPLNTALANMTPADLQKLAALVPESISLEVAGAAVKPPAAAADSAPKQEKTKAFAETDAGLSHEQTGHVYGVLKNLFESYSKGVDPTKSLPENLPLNEKVVAMACSISMYNQMMESRNGEQANREPTSRGTASDPTQPPPKRQKTMDQRAPGAPKSRLEMLSGLAPKEFDRF